MRIGKIVLDMELDMPTINGVKNKFCIEGLKGHAIAIIVHNGRILLVNRAASKTGNRLCLPGGNIRENETFQKGIIREMKEELNITLLNPKPVAKITNRFLNKGKKIMESPGYIYFTQNLEGIPRANSLELLSIEYCGIQSIPDLKFKNKEILEHVLLGIEKPINLLYKRD